MGYARTKLEEAVERVKALEDQLGDWNATFPHRTASDVIALLQQANTERDDLKAKLEEAESKCAEMRDALRDAQMHIEADNIDWARFNEGPDHDPNYHPLFPEIVTRCEKALATDAGKGWKSPAQYDDIKAKLEEAEERCQSVSVLHRSNGWKSPEEYEALQKENESLRVEYESRVVWIENMNKILGYDNSDGFHSEPDPHAIAMALRRKNESLSREWDIMRAALQIIAQDIGSNHAATKAKEALSALVKEGE